MSLNSFKDNLVLYSTASSILWCTFRLFQNSHFLYLKKKLCPAVYFLSNVEADVEGKIPYSYRSRISRI